MRTGKVATPNRRLIRFSLLIALSASILIVGVAFFIYREEIRNYRQNISIEQASHLKNQTTVIRENLRHSTYSLLFLTNQIRLHQAFKTTTGLKALANDFISFLDSNELYDRISLLDIHGMEVLNVRYDAGKPGIAPEGELQWKGGRDAFVRRIMLSTNDLYISPMVLATEHGEVEQPIKPMIQFGMPVFDRQGRKTGMLILNYLAETMLNHFKEVAGFRGSTVGESMLLNHNGYWLSNPDSRDEWGFMFVDRRQKRLGVAAPAAWRKISRKMAGHFFMNADQYHFTTLYPAEIVSTVTRINVNRASRQTFWKIVCRYPQTAFMVASREIRNAIILPTLSIMLLMNGMVWFMAWTMIRRRQTEDELEQLHLLEKERASHMTMLGRMSAEIAHELHQPLSAILSYTDTCLRLMKAGKVQPDRLSKILGKISGQADRAGHVVRRVGNFARSQEMQRTSMDLNILINETLSLAELETRKYRVKTRKKLKRLLPPVFADRLLIQQVLLNLIRNACEAMEGIGLHKRILTIRTDRIDNDYAKVSVHDQGPGLAMDELEHMFDAFFSLKKEGMGLGLSVSRSMVENHGGRLWAEKFPETGMVVCFTLPIVKELHYGD
ncbi:MAG: ATP-binding protein [Mariprofundaceae bacterium]|nr:ATP-binding protein [Mariprofundaceae bacterium]